MEFIRAGEALLRSTQPLLPFLAPAIHRPRLPSPASRRQLLRREPVRLLTSSRAYQQQEPGSTPTPEQNNAEEQQPSASSSNITPEFGQLLDSVLNRSKGSAAASANRASRFKSSSGQHYNSSPRERRPAPTSEQEGAIAALLDTLGSPNPNRPAATRRTPGGTIDIAAMLDPTRNVPRPATPAPPSVPPPAPMKLNSSVGRTIHVDTLRNMDVARAFRTLDIQLARNRVRQDFRMQKFYERPGLKRKRLKRERWRRRFKATFQNTIRMVQRMKAQGW